MLCWGEEYGEGVIPHGGSFTSVSVGFRQACGLQPDATLACWWHDDLTAAPVPAGSFLSVGVSLSERDQVKGGDNVCALRTDGTVVCWGRGAVGLSPGGSFTSIEMGIRDSSCALTSDGTPACWNYVYGRGTKKTPPPPPGTAFTMASPGHGHVCGIRNGGSSIECWGHNQFGQAGPPGDAFQLVSLGHNFVCGLKTNGGVTCWGYDPHEVTTHPPDESFVSIEAGGHHTCGIKTDGAVLCWGRAEHIGTPAEGPFESVSAGNLQTCGIRPDGSMACWNEKETWEQSGGPYISVGVGGDTTAPSKPAAVQCAGEATPRVKPMRRMDHSHQWPPDFTPVAASGPTVRWSAGEITCGKPKPQRGTHLCLPERSQLLPAAEKAPDGAGEPGQNIAPVEGVEFTQHLGRLTLAVDGDGYRPRVGHQRHPHTVG